MRKIWILPTAIFLLLALLCAVLAGFIIMLGQQKAHQDLQARMQTQIAVVNADTGAMVDGVKQGYASTIIEQLGSNYSLVSYNMAQNGYSDGTYGAILIFPSDVSSKILSFNSSAPERVQLEFVINPSLPEEAYIETYVEILNLQMSINSNIAYTYVSSIYGQFHGAQDNVNAIFENDSLDMAALETLVLGNFTDALNLGDLPVVPLEPHVADTNSYMVQVSRMVSDVSNEYLDSYGAASKDYKNMREGLFALTEGFPEQEDAWLSDLTEWTNISVEYGEEVHEFAEAVEEYETDLREWHKKNIEWQDALKKYTTDITSWYERGEIWVAESSVWYEKFQEYLNESVLYMEDSAQYRAALTECIGPVLDDHAVWGSALGAYAADLQTVMNSLGDVGPVEDVAAELWTWRTLIMETQERIDEMEDMPKAGDFETAEEYAEALVLYIDEMNQMIEDWEELSGFDASILDKLPLASVESAFFKGVPAYKGATIPAEPPEIPVPTTLFPEAPELLTPPEYDGNALPGAVETLEEAEAEQPENPLVPPPPRPDDFWASLGLMHSQLSSFEVDEYLSDNVKQQVAAELSGYETYLGTVREDLSRQFDVNIGMMWNVHSAYNEYLYLLRDEAYQTEAAEQNQLRSLLDEFAAVKTENSEDTQSLLYDFAGMMPESRTTVGVNRELVGFTVSPFEFQEPELRANINLGWDSAAMQKTYLDYLWIALAASAVALALTGCLYLRARGVRNRQE